MVASDARTSPTRSQDTRADCGPICGCGACSRECKHQVHPTHPSHNLQLPKSPRFGIQKASCTSQRHTHMHCVSIMHAPLRTASGIGASQHCIVVAEVRVDRRMARCSMNRNHFFPLLARSAESGVSLFASNTLHLPLASDPCSTDRRSRAHNRAESLCRQSKAQE